MTKAEAKEFLRICKRVDAIKFNSIIKDLHLSQPSISRFINDDRYDDFVSIDTLEKLCIQVYSNCLFVVDMYHDIIEHKNIA